MALGLRRGLRRLPGLGIPLARPQGGGQPPNLPTPPSGYEYRRVVQDGQPVIQDGQRVFVLTPIAA